MLIEWLVERFDVLIVVGGGNDWMMMVVIRMMMMVMNGVESITVTTQKKL
jgi:hypothetical protein